MPESLTARVRERPEPRTGGALGAALFSALMFGSSVRLPLLVPFSRYQHDVSFARGLDCPRDRRSPIRLDLQAARTSKHLLDDGERVLASRVVGSDDRDVCELCGDSPHHRPLVAVAVAAAAEHADDTPGSEVSCFLEDALQRRRLVRVVDDHRERLTLLDEL